MLRIFSSVSNLPLLTIDDYYYHPYDKMVKRKQRPGRHVVWVLVGVRGCVPRPTGHSLVTLFSLSVSVKDQPLHQILVRSQTYYPEHILVYGSREGSLFSCRGFRLFSDRLIGVGDGGGLSTTLSSGLRSGGLESKFGWRPRPHDRRMVGWSCLCLGYKWGVCFGVPSWATLIRESPRNAVRLGYDLASQ